MSFFEWKIGANLVSRFVSLRNYAAVLTDGVFGGAVVNTAFYALTTVPLQIIVGLSVAVLLQSIPRCRIAFRIMYFLPVITSWVIVSLVFRFLFANEGLLNYLITDVLRVAAQRIPWLDVRFPALTALGLLGVWKGVGWNMVIFLAALETIPVELYEVAALDGCGRIRTFIRITVPSIMNTVFFTLVMLTIGAFNAFTSIRLITEGRPAHQTEVALTWMYYKAFGTQAFGYAAALSYIIALTIGTLTLLQFGYLRRLRA